MPGLVVIALLSICFMSSAFASVQENTCEQAVGINRTQRACPKAFEVRVLSHYNDLLRWGKSISRSVTTAEDLAQETVIKALGSWSSFQPGTNLSHWLYTILQNSYIDLGKRPINRPEYSISLGDTEWITTASYPATEDSILIKQIQDLMKKNLTPERYYMLRLAAMGHPYEKIGEILKLPLGTVKSRIGRTRNKLRKYIEGEQ